MNKRKERLSKKKHGIEQRDNGDEEYLLSDRCAKSFEEETFAVAGDTPVSLPVVPDSFKEDTFVEDNQSYMEYAVADDTFQRQLQQLYNSFEEETFVEDSQSYME